MVEDFLASVRSNTTHAAWMAGDLLGAHWPEKDGLVILERVATTARYAAGRAAAISGLGTAMRRREKSAKDKDEFRSLLEQAMNNDKSKHVQLAAQISLDVVDR